jgi:hypothetical protein
VFSGAGKHSRAEVEPLFSNYAVLASAGATSPVGWNPLGNAHPDGGLARFYFELQGEEA